MSDYPDNWRDISLRIRAAAGNCCERCKHPHDPSTGYCLTVHHLDGNKANCQDWNLAALCQRCHLKIQGRVKMNQLFFLDLLPVSGWFKPHYEGFLKDVATRREAELERARIEWQCQNYEVGAIIPAKKAFDAGARYVGCDETALLQYLFTEPVPPSLQECFNAGARWAMQGRRPWA